MTTDMMDWLCRRIVEEAQDAVVFADRDGVIRLWNAAAEAMFGYAGQEAIGRPLDLIVPERQREAHWNGFRRVMATGVTKYGRDLLKVPGVRKDGSRLSLEFSIALLRDDDGAMAGAVAIMRDVTERWQEERALRRRLAAQEERLS